MYECMYVSLFFGTYLGIDICMILVSMYGMYFISYGCMDCIYVLLPTVLNFHTRPSQQLRGYQESLMSCIPASHQSALFSPINTYKPGRD